jgi:hypothetical protein
MASATFIGDRPPIRADEFRERILAKEQKAIDARRTDSRRTDSKIAPLSESGAVGLALSGGGIRSAAFCFGTLQALNEVGAYRHVDYLSPVSGGGYAGAALTSTMRAASKFAFGYPADPDARPLDAIHNRNESRAVRHIRDNSNFLLPRGGWRDQPINLLIIIRGLLINAVSALAILLFLACATLLFVPNDRLLRAFAAWPSYAGWAAAAAGVFLLAWAMFRSVPRSRPQESLPRDPRAGASLDVKAAAGSEVTDGSRRVAMLVGYLALLALAFACNLSLIAWLWRDAALTHSWILHHYNLSVGVIWATMIAISGGVAAFSGRIGKILKFVPLSLPGGAGAWKLYAKRGALWAALVVASLPMPLALYACYVTLVLWGLPVNGASTMGPGESEPLFLYPRTPVWLVWPRPSATALSLLSAAFVAAILVKEFRRSGAIIFIAVIAALTVSKLTLSSSLLATIVVAMLVWTFLDTSRLQDSIVIMAVIIIALLIVASVIIFFGIYPIDARAGIGATWLDNAVARAYAPWLAFTVGLSWMCKPNANSLHGLYRDRIRNTFLFKPWDDERETSGDNKWTDPGRWESDWLSDYQNCKGPYPLINATVNLRGSARMNRRGRDANFFVFTPHVVGSDATGYAPTEAIQAADPNLGLATAVAISGAAISANMGTKSIRQLTMTLALLNIRLGYWLTNPMYAANRHWLERIQDGSNF